jgi:hypothetical protein
MLYTQGIINTIKIIQIKIHTRQYITDIFNLQDLISTFLLLWQKIVGIEDTVTSFIDVEKSNINVLILGSSSTDYLVVACFNVIFQHSYEGIV